MFGLVEPSPAALVRAAFDCSNLLCVNAIPIKKPPLWGGFLIGGLEEIRTPDPHNANVVRSQLRYEPVDKLIIVFCSSFVKISICIYKLWL